MEEKSTEEERERTGERERERERRRERKGEREKERKNKLAFLRRGTGSVENGGVGERRGC